MTGLASAQDRLVGARRGRYRALGFRDRSTTLPGRAFRDATSSRRFERGGLVRVRPRRRALSRRAVPRRPHVAPAPGRRPGRLPARAYRDLAELDGFFEHLAREVHDGDLREWLRAVFGDAALRDAFRRAPCTRAGHQPTSAGLLEHTVAVGDAGRRDVRAASRADSDVLICAALLHDAARRGELPTRAEIRRLDEGRLLGHGDGQRLIEERAAGVPGTIGSAVLPLRAVPPRRRAPFGSAEAAALHRINRPRRDGQGRPGATGL